jgi:hypothetical protein
MPGKKDPGEAGSVQGEWVFEVKSLEIRFKNASVARG